MKSVLLDTPLMQGGCYGYINFRFENQTILPANDEAHYGVYRHVQHRGGCEQVENRTTARGYDTQFLQVCHLQMSTDMRCLRLPCAPRTQRYRFMDTLPSEAPSWHSRAQDRYSRSPRSVRVDIYMKWQQRLPRWSPRLLAWGPSAPMTFQSCYLQSHSYCHKIHWEILIDIPI